MRIPDVWRNILERAIRTPSPHNTQPWRVRVVDGRRAELFLDRDRLLPNEDLTGCFQVSAAGLFIEAVSLLAADRGYRLGVVVGLIDLSLPMIPVAELSLMRDADVASPGVDVGRLGTRRTSRLPHTGGRLGAEAEAELGRLAEDFDQSFGYTADPAMIERVLARNTEAVFADMNSPTYHDEFVGWLRTPREAECRRDGLELACMRIDRSEYFLLRRWPGALKLAGLRGLMVRRYRRTLGKTDHVGWVAGPFWDYASAIRAGRFLLRFWLTLDAEGMSIHPFGNLVTHPDAHRWVTETFDTDGVWMVFRFGRTAEAPVSCRRTLREVLLD